MTTCKPNSRTRKPAAPVKAEPVAPSSIPVTVAAPCAPARIADATDAQIMDPCWRAATLQKALLSLVAGQTVRITRQGESWLEFTAISDIKTLRDMANTARLECEMTQAGPGGQPRGRAFRFGPYSTMRRL